MLPRSFSSSGKKVELTATKPSKRKNVEDLPLTQTATRQSKRLRVGDPELSWQIGQAFWMTRGVVLRSNPPQKIKFLEELVKKHQIARELPSIGKREMDELTEIDRHLFLNNFPPFLVVRKCQKIDGLGVFATEDMPEGKVLGVFAGIVETKKNLDNLYWVELSSHYPSKIIVNAGERGNYTRFFNSAFPGKNANVRNKGVKIRGATQLLFKTDVPVKAGQQLLMDYKVPTPVPLSPSDQ